MLILIIITVTITMIKRMIEQRIWVILQFSEHTDDYFDIIGTRNFRPSNTASDAFSNLLSISVKKRFEDIRNVRLSIRSASPIGKIRIIVFGIFKDGRCKFQSGVILILPVLYKIYLIKSERALSCLGSKSYLGPSCI